MMGCLSWLVWAAVMAVVLGWMYYMDPGLLWLVGLSVVIYAAIAIHATRNDKNRNK